MSAIAILRASFQDFRKSWIKLILPYAVASGIFMLLQYFLQPVFTRYAFQYNEVVKAWCYGSNLSATDYVSHYGFHLPGIALYLLKLLLGWIQGAVVGLLPLLVLKRPDAPFKDQCRYFGGAFFRFWGTVVFFSLFSTAFFFLKDFFTGLPFRMIDSNAAVSLATLIKLLFGLIFWALIPFSLFFSTFWSLSVFEDGRTVWGAFRHCWDLLTMQFWRSTWIIIKLMFFISLPIVIVMKIFALFGGWTLEYFSLLAWVLLFLSAPLMAAASRHVYLALDERETLAFQSKTGLSDRFLVLSQEVYDRKKEMGLLTDEEEEHILPDPIVGEPLWVADAFENQLHEMDEENELQEQSEIDSDHPLSCEPLSPIEEIPSEKADSAPTV